MTLTAEMSLLAVAATLFSALTAVFIRLGAKRTDFSFAASVYAVAALPFLAVCAWLSGGAAELATLDNRTLLILAISGLLKGMSLLALFYALAKHEVRRAAPLYALAPAWVFLAGGLLLHTATGLWRTLGCLMLAAGCLILACRRGKGSKKAAAFPTFALLATLLAATDTLLMQAVALSAEPWLARATQLLAAAIALWLFTAFRSGSKPIKKADFSCWLFLLLAAASTGLAALCYCRLQMLGDASAFAPLYAAQLLLTLLAARLILGEKLSGAAWLGAVLTLAGGICMELKI